MFSLCFLYVLTGFEAVEEGKSWRYLNQQVMLAIQLYLDDTIMGYHNYALLVELTRSVHNMGWEGNLASPAHLAFQGFPPMMSPIVVSAEFSKEILDRWTNGSILYFIKIRDFQHKSYVLLVPPEQYVKAWSGKSLSKAICSALFRGSCDMVAAPQNGKNAAGWIWTKGPQCIKMILENKANLDVTLTCYVHIHSTYRINKGHRWHRGGGRTFGQVLFILLQGTFGDLGWAVGYYIIILNEYRFPFRNNGFCFIEVLRMVTKWLATS